MILSSPIIMAATIISLLCGTQSAAAQDDAPVLRGQDLPITQLSLSSISGLTAESTIGELLMLPALQGFADRILPWAGRNYDRSMPIRQVARLLPYHSEIRPQVVLDGINRIIADRAAGKPVFHEIYSEAERRTDPDLRETGLFFFAGPPGAPFAIIAPGGGFSYVGSVHEGFPYAQAINASGFNAFVLTYRTGRGEQVATQDMARAIDYIMDHASDFLVSQEGYSLWGSSAGARMAASIGSHGPRAFAARTTARPAAVVMAYTSHADYGATEPPTYVVVGEKDRIAPPQNMGARIRNLIDMGIETEFRIVPDVAHGFGLGSGTKAEGWVRDAAKFWKQHLPQ